MSRRSRSIVGLALLCGLIGVVFFGNRAGAVIKDGCCNVSGSPGCPYCPTEPDPDDFGCDQSGPYADGTCQGTDPKNSCAFNTVTCFDKYECILGFYVGFCYKSNSTNELYSYSGCYDQCTD